MEGSSSHGAELCSVLNLDTLLSPTSFCFTPSFIHILQLSPWGLRPTCHAHLKSHSTRNQRAAPKLLDGVEMENKHYKQTQLHWDTRNWSQSDPKLRFYAGKNSQLHQTYSELPHKRLHRLSKDFTENFQWCLEQFLCFRTRENFHICTTRTRCAPAAT